MGTVTNGSVYGRGFVVALTLAALAGCAVTTGAGQSRLTIRQDAAASYPVCAGVHASRLAARGELGRPCRRAEALRVIL